MNITLRIGNYTYPYHPNKTPNPVATGLEQAVINLTR